MSSSLNFYWYLITGPDSFANLKKLAEQFQKREANRTEGGDDDDDVPELVEGETFEEAAKTDSAS